MKTIVVPTDFSVSAEHATLYAAQLAKTIRASVLLLHVYQMPVTMSDFPVLIVSADELKQNADEALRRAKEAAQKAMPDVTFEMESRMGDVAQEINDVCAGRELAVLVTGTKDLSGFEKFLMGSTTISIIKNCSFPVIAVPEKAPLRLPSKIALAVDLFHPEDIPVQKIKELVSLLNAELHVVHIEEDGRKLTANSLPPGLQEVTCHSLKEDDVTKGIQHFASENGIDLVMVMPHKHSFYERVFFKGHTQGIINAMPVPVMCIR
ncbi:MAG TPA: universal stress protein [Flavisolibacter sp.]|jgi:nucleotide-binding universal stress UspA family protein